MGMILPFSTHSQTTCIALQIIEGEALHIIECEAVAQSMATDDPALQPRRCSPSAALGICCLSTFLSLSVLEVSQCDVTE